MMNELPTRTDRIVNATIWWLFRAPYRARAAIDRQLPLVPEPVAVLMAGGAVWIALEQAWPILPLYVAACAISVAALKRAAR